MPSLPSRILAATALSALLAAGSSPASATASSTSGSVAALPGDMAYPAVPGYDATIAVDAMKRVGARAWITYHRVSARCFNEEGNWHPVIHGGVHHVWVDRDARVQILDGVHGGWTRTSARRLPAHVNSAANGGQPYFLVRHRSVGHLEALRQAYVP